MIQLIMLLLLMVHWVGCIWYLLIDPNIAGNSTLWVPMFELDETKSTDFCESSTMNQYLVTFYYAIILLIGRANEMGPVTFA
jgi:hypothetical protein